MTDKTIAYMENKNSGDWQNTIMFMGDDDPKLSNVNTHMRDINDVAEEVRKAHPAYMIKKVMWDAYTRETSSTGNRYPDIENIVKQQQANGALIMNYAGHGSESSMSHERVLVLDDFQNFQNANLPLWVINACDIMPFDASMATIGEEAVLNKKGGAVAVYSTSRTVYQDRNKKMNSVFMRYALSLDSDGKPLRLGDAVRLSKNNINGRDVNDIHYHLLGDPAMALHLPTYDVVVDSINLLVKIKTGDNGEGGQRQRIGIATNEVKEDDSGHKTYVYTLYHAQNGVPEYYSTNVYLSIPVAGINTGDKIVVNINDYRPIGKVPWLGQAHPISQIS